MKYLDISSLFMKTVCQGLEQRLALDNQTTSRLVSSASITGLKLFEADLFFLKEFLLYFQIIYGFFKSFFRKRMSTSLKIRLSALSLF